MKSLPDLFRHGLKRAGRAFFVRRVEVKDVFAKFRDVLEGNNRALEIMTDMGEKLGGDYLFDTVYIEKAYAELRSDIIGSLSEFNLLTKDKHDIASSFRRIDSIITKVLSEEVPLLSEGAVFYDDITAEMAREVGGKNYTLSRLRKDLKLNVPDGFAIPSHVYDAFISRNEIDKRIGSLKHGPSGEGDVEAVRDLVLKGVFPEPLEGSLEQALRRLKSRAGNSVFLAVRSSGEGEDGEYSFAGQFDTVLNVPAEIGEVREAYRRVVASLFSPSSRAYQKRLGYRIGEMRMSVGCMVMVDARAAGVLYTADPASGKETLAIHATWGLGKPVVEGKVETDIYVLGKKPVLVLESVRIGSKKTMTVLSEEGGTREIEAPHEMKGAVCLTEGQTLDLARMAVQIERYFNRPQDIEWALGKDGSIYILQARPLKMALSEKGERTEISPDRTVLMKDRGQVVQKGIVSGRVYVLNAPAEIDNLPRGAVLVARYDSPQFVRAMPHLAAIITDTGTTASHMASICREFRIPCVVNTGEATRVLQHGEEVTLVADGEDNFFVYEGVVQEMRERVRDGLPGVEELYEFRKKKYLMRYIAPLHLINPLTDDFTPEKCETMHDILRFMHEKSVQELIDASMRASVKGALKKLVLAVPAGIHVIDIGGGLKPVGTDSVTLEQVESGPLKAVAQGMTSPGMWHSEAVALGAKDFMTSMMRMEDITAGGGRYASRNVAVVSKEYLNLTVRFGYHFCLLDCFCSDRASNNHIYFRFTGGATDITKRSRRIQLIAEILKEHGFISVSKGDLITARLSGIEKTEILKILDMTGRLIAYTRQLDALLNDDGDIEKYKRQFAENIN